MSDMTLNGISADRLGDRKKVLAALDTFRRQADASGMMEDGCLCAQRSES
ncbi:MAG: hypothetical protein R3C12_24115 [Planctomycetaceae bacterium]